MKVAFKGNELQIGEFFFQLTSAQIRKLRKDLGHDLNIIEHWIWKMRDHDDEDVNRVIAAMRKELGGR